MTTIALLGAAGRTGRQVIAQAPARGVKIKTLARDQSKLAGLDLEVVAGDVRDEAALRRLFSGLYERYLASQAGFPDDPMRGKGEVPKKRG
jgi:uncharacterized protein YbjT (DUF2867 family)